MASVTEPWYRSLTLYGQKFSQTLVDEKINFNWLSIRPWGRVRREYNWGRGIWLNLKIHENNKWSWNLPNSDCKTVCVVCINCNKCFWMLNNIAPKSHDISLVMYPLLLSNSERVDDPLSCCHHCSPSASSPLHTLLLPSCDIWYDVSIWHDAK